MRWVGEGQKSFASCWGPSGAVEAGEVGGAAANLYTLRAKGGNTVWHGRRLFCLQSVSQMLWVAEAGRRCGAARRAAALQLPPPLTRRCTAQRGLRAAVFSVLCIPFVACGAVLLWPHGAQIRDFLLVK